MPCCALGCDLFEQVVASLLDGAFDSQPALPVDEVIRPISSRASTVTDMSDAAEFGDHTLTGAVAELATGRLRPFSDWPPPDLEKGPPGVYTVWRGDEFLYVGISYRDSRDTANPAAKGVFGRLASHASGRRSGDQFNVYVCDHYVIPELTRDDLEALRNGDRFLDQRTRDYVATRLCYRVWIAPSGDDARRVEGHVRRHGLATKGKPVLNPLITKG